MDRFMEGFLDELVKVAAGVQPSPLRDLRNLTLGGGGLIGGALGASQGIGHEHPGLAALGGAGLGVAGGLGGALLGAKGGRAAAKLLRKMRVMRAEEKLRQASMNARKHSRRPSIMKRRQKARAGVSEAYRSVGPDAIRRMGETGTLIGAGAGLPAGAVVGGRLLRGDRKREE
jgi:hypothetical protein